jgi:hypothetical protein
MYKESKKRLVVTRESNNPIFSLSVCSEVLDGLRIYFDFTYKDLLLYKSEQGQIETAAAVYTSPMPPDTDESSSNKNELNYMDYITYPNNFSEDEYQNDKALQRKRSLRSNKSTDGVSNGNCQSEGATKAKPVSRSVGGFHTKNTSFGFSASRLIRRGRDR